MGLLGEGSNRSPMVVSLLMYAGPQVLMGGGGAVLKYAGPDGERRGGPIG